MNIVDGNSAQNSLDEICNSYKENLLREMQLVQSQVARENPSKRATAVVDTDQIDDLSSDCDDDNDSEKSSERTEAVPNYDRLRYEKVSTENDKLNAMNNDLKQRNELLEKTNKELQERMGEMLHRLKKLEETQNRRNLAPLVIEQNELKTPKDRKQINSSWEVRLNTPGTQKTVRETWNQQSNKENNGGDSGASRAQNQMIIDEVNLELFIYQRIFGFDSSAKYTRLLSPLI